ncbi:MAG TPA: xanthine dehydrogenase accessory protein XdhC [Rhizomicrobium sp.]|nr:xanthine dehydrogenase accessory protein XdhC [Rhizomicrobium sp.]
MSSWWSLAAARIAEAKPVVLVTICAVEGSAPREAGAKMLVWDDAQDGTVGGGKLEFTIVDQARRMLAGDVPWRIQHYPLGPLLGQCCGGRVGILLERLGPESAGWLGVIAAAERTGKPYTVVSRLGAGGIAREISPCDAVVADVPLLVRAPPGEVIATRIGEGFTLIEHVRPQPRLLMFGAGHVGQALAPIMRTLPFDLTWLDLRPDFAGTGATVTGDLLGAVRTAPPGSFALIFTHSHDLDYQLCRAVLARGDFRYCGLIGSATKRTRFEKRLAVDGVARSGLICPIGEIGLASKVPQVMAVAIAAELLLELQKVAIQALPQKAGAKAGNV